MLTPEEYRDLHWDENPYGDDYDEETEGDDEE